MGTTKTEQVIAYLRAAIARGEIEPGQPIREKQLAEALGMSRTPVREALQRAQTTGLVQYSAHRGVTASELATADIVDIFRIRSRLEPLATELAAGCLTPEQLAELQANNDELERLSTTDATVEEAHQLTTAWHDMIYRAAGSPRLYSLIASVLSWSPRDTLRIPGRIDLTVREHQQIVVALRHREASLAGRLMEAHLLSAIASLLGERDERHVSLVAEPVKDGLPAA